MVMYYGWKIPQSMAAILQFPDSITAIMPSLAASPRFHVDAVRMDSHSCDAVAFCMADPAWPSRSRHLPAVVLMQ